MLIFVSHNNEWWIQGSLTIMDPLIYIWDKGHVAGIKNNNSSTCQINMIMILYLDFINPSVTLRSDRPPSARKKQ